MITSPTLAPLEPPCSGEPVELRFATAELRERAALDDPSRRWLARMRDDRSSWAASGATLAAALRALATGYVRDVRPAWVREGHLVEVLVEIRSLPSQLGHLPGAFVAGRGGTLGAALLDALERRLPSIPALGEVSLDDAELYA